MEAIKYKVVDVNGKEVGSIDLDPRVFGAEVNQTLVHETVRWQLNKRRSGNHSTLGRSDMKGGGKKPWRQKGTGRARAGSNVSPLWVGGAQSHGPKPRSYEFRLPKRTRRQALVSVLSDKVNNQNLIVLDELSVPSGKTRDMAGIADKIGIAEHKTVLLNANLEDTVLRAAGNICNLSVIEAGGVNVYDLMRTKYLVATRKGIEAIQNRLAGE